VEWWWGERSSWPGFSEQRGTQAPTTLASEPYHRTI
jgi:hypothetical protein